MFHRILILIATLLFTVALAACGQGQAEDVDADADPTETAEASETAAESDDAEASDDPAREAAITVEDLVADPETYLGEEIYVTNEVAETVAPGAFTLAGIEDEHALLVIDPSGESSDVEAGAFVQVTGTLLDPEDEQVTDALDSVGLTDDDLDDLDDLTDDAVLVAESIEVTSDAD